MPKLRKMLGKIDSQEWIDLMRLLENQSATTQTPTNTLGYLFYGAAAVAYSEVGLEEAAEVYYVSPFRYAAGLSPKHFRNVSE